MEDVVKFLAQYEWLYNFKLTRFLLDKVWDHASDEVE